MTIDGRRTLKKNRWLYFFKERKNINDNKIIEKRQPLMVDSLWWKIVFDGRSFWWKTAFDGRRPLMEDILWWKTPFDGRHTLMEDNLWTHPLMEYDLWWKIVYDLWWKTPFDAGQPFMETIFYVRVPLMIDDLWWKTSFQVR